MLGAVNLPAALVDELPAAVRERLHTCCFEPDGPEARELSARFGAHVVTYRREHPPAPPGGVELCRSIAMADLSPDELAALGEVEERVGATLVAYARPVRVLRSPGTR